MRNAWTRILLVLTLRCQEAEQIRVRASHEEATGVEKLAEVLHRSICGPCRAAARQHRRMDEVLRQYRLRESGLSTGPGEDVPPV